MHWLDILLLIVLGAGAALGAWSGLLWQVARIVTFCVAIYACFAFHEPVAAFLSEHIEGVPELGMKLLSFVVTFVGIFATFYTGTWLLERAIKAAELKLYDRILGGLAGALQMALVAGAILMGLALYATDSVEGTFRESHITPWLLKGMRVVIVAVPQEYKDKLSDSIDKLKEESLEEAEKRVLEGEKGK